MSNKAVNPEMITLARELRGMKQSDLSKATGIDQGTLSKYENGAREVSDKDLKFLIKVLNYPPEFFYRSGRRFGLGTSALFHRKRQNAPAAILNWLEAKFNELLITLPRLIDGVEFAERQNFPQFTVSAKNTPEQIAANLRAAWGLPSGPIKNLTEAIEDAGGIVISFDFGSPRIDAVSQYIKPLPPIFLVNETAPGDRLRFTLAHEIGHMVMHLHDGISDEFEDEADEFASAFLMPRQDIKRDLQPVNLPHLAQLKLYWRVSIQALIRRSRDINVIDESLYRKLFTDLSKSGQRKIEPNPIPIERPTLLREIFDVYINDYGYRKSEVAKIFCIYEEEFRTFYLREPVITKINVPSMPQIGKKGNS